jgi:23S rRNA pseudouridine2604 synthase
MADEQRLSKLMSQRGLCSRREADRYIEKGLVRVDGKVVNTLGVKFLPSVKIELTSVAQAQQNSRLTIMINKPVGYVSSQAEEEYIPAVRLVRNENRSDIDTSGVSTSDYDLARAHDLAPAGRLDIDSQGLLILTQDGRIAKLLIGEDNNIEKEYLVRVDGIIEQEKIEQLQFGMSLDGKPLKRAKVRQINPEQIQIILHEGKKRQIRRMCDEVGLHVTGLKRVRIGEVRLGKLAEGEWRVVSPEEFEHSAPDPSSGDDFRSRNEPKEKSNRRESLYGKRSREQVKEREQVKIDHPSKNNDQAENVELKKKREPLHLKKQSKD